MYVYKFRAPEQIEFAFDILLNRRLYCAEWRTLNDPMEGVFRHAWCVEADDFKQQIDGIVSHQVALRVCSLTKNHRSHLLWSHYAGGHRGLAIQIWIPDECKTTFDVTYANESPIVERDRPIDAQYAARALLTWKHSEWAYERELRIIQPDEFFGPIQITRVFFGMRMHPSLREAMQIVCDRLEIETTRVYVV